MCNVQKIHGLGTPDHTKLGNSAEPALTTHHASGTGHVARVEEFEVANMESLRLGRDADKICCIVDPAGYFWEVLERHERNVTEALCKVRALLAPPPHTQKCKL